MMITTDGAASPNPGPAAIGAVIKDEGGNIITTISHSIGYATNNQAEYRAIIIALEMAIRLGAEQVELYSDSQLVVRQVSGHYRVKATALLPLYQKIKELKNQLKTFTINHISGETNEAHNLANDALGKSKLAKFHSY